MEKKEIIKELRAILKTHYYDVKGTKQPLKRETMSNMLGSKVATKLENLLGQLLREQPKKEESNQLEFNFNQEEPLLVELN